MTWRPVINTLLSEALRVRRRPPCKTTLSAKATIESQRQDLNRLNVRANTLEEREREYLALIEEFQKQDTILKKMLHK